MSQRREKNADTDARAVHAAVGEQRTNVVAPSSQDDAAQRGPSRRSPPLSFSPRRAGSPQDAGAQQQ
jgi:hypothetical protein